MSLDGTPLKCELKSDGIVVNEDLRITFKRTIRVSDDQKISYLPSDMGDFPLKPISEYADTLPPAMAAKGGVFLPMYQSEAMWIKFRCSQHWVYMIKIHVGGVNAISGEHAMEDGGTKLRRLAKLARQHKKGNTKNISLPLQDYIIVPGQEWLDGVADSDGTVRQFVSMPFASGHSVEAQITGNDATGGIQFEIVPYRRLSSKSLTWDVQPVAHQGPTQIFVKTLTGTLGIFGVNLNESVKTLKARITSVSGVPIDQQRLLFNGKQMEESRTLAEYKIGRDSTIHFVLRLRGGGEPVREMSIAVGGKIHQVIREDHHEADGKHSRITVFNVQILNSAAYQAVTGNSPPTEPMTVETYKKHGFPFFKLYEESSGISGNFGMVKSVSDLDQREEDTVKPRTVPINYPPAPVPVGIINPDGPLRPFRTAQDLAEEFSSLHIADF
ncbi:integral membrane protein [Phaeosphaeria sp. MPI-PUGE-AT-0046c]|nr:integral membrane protein [Phaeosphaeria sp. MPI-PUGE-AT-0046c]